GGRTGRSRSISRGRVAWLYPSSTIDWRRWPSARASGRADASTDRGAREPRRAHRATSHKQRLENDPGNVLRVDEPEPHPVPPGGVRVPAKTARTLRREQRPYGAARSKTPAASAELGKPRWCPRRSRVRGPRRSGFVFGV